MFRSLPLVVVVVLAATVAAWVTWVPSAVSATTFGWLMAAGAVVTGVTLAIMSRAQPTRSIAHVLYDVEHPSKPRP
jgi:hypothetical protein